MNARRQLLAALSVAFLAAAPAVGSEPALNWPLAWEMTTPQDDTIHIDVRNGAPGGEIVLPAVAGDLVAAVESAYDGRPLSYALTTAGALVIRLPDDLVGGTTRLVVRLRVFG